LNMPLFDNKPFKFPAAIRLTFTTPTVGEHTLGFGYYGSKGNITNKIMDGKTIADYSQKTAFTQGIVKNIFPEKRDAIILKFPSFEIDAQFNPGMSGGPVFNEKGFVCGIVCSSMPLEETGEHLSYVSLLWPSLGTLLEVKLGEQQPLQMHTFYEIVKSGWIKTDESINAIQVQRNQNDKIS